MASKKENENFTENSGETGKKENKGMKETNETRSGTSSRKKERESQEESRQENSARFYDRPGSFREEQEQYYGQDQFSSGRYSGRGMRDNDDGYYERGREPSGYSDRRGEEGWYGRQHGYEQYGDEGYGGYYRRRNRMRSLNFEKYAEEGNRFVNEIAYELGTRSRDKAARILRAVLHAVRDRLPAADAVQFAQGLPMALKGIFIDQYDISSTPVVIRNKEDFIDLIVEKNKFAAAEDFPHPDDVVWGLKTVFHVLEYHMDPGQINHIKKLLHSEIVDLIES